MNVYRQQNAEEIKHFRKLMLSGGLQRAVTAK